MEIITFYCRGEPLTLTRNEIETLCDSDWFISLLIKYNDNGEKTELLEDINIVKGILETLRYKKLVMYKNISLGHMKLLCDKWCVPNWVTEEIEKKEEIETKLTIHNTDEPVLVCYICRVGFKKSENTSTSCKKHRSTCSSDGVFFCCNTQEPCCVGFHYVHNSG